MWTLVTFFSTCYCIYLIVESIASFLSYEVVTRIDDWPKSPLEFPAVSFCNLNKPKTAYSLDEILIFCEFNSKNCTSSEFFVKYIDLQYGDCYRFNDKSDKLSFKSGSLLGLQIHLFTGLANDFLDVGSTSYGLRVFIHNQSEYPSNLNGIDISTGFKTNLMIKQRYDVKLPSPYNECQNNAKYPDTLIDTLNNMSYLAYKQSTCIDLHFLEHFAKKCNYSGNLNSISQSFNSRLNGSDKKSVFSCLADITGEFYNQSFYEKYGLKCPLECESMDYAITTSMSKFPSRAIYLNLEKLRKLFNGSYSYENLTDTLLSFVVYYDELKYTMISQHEKTKLQDLISNIGGLFGLFLGMSFLSFIELAELLGEVILILI